MPTATKGRPPTWTPLTILRAVRTFYARVGHWPEPRDWRASADVGLPTRQTVVRVLGSLEELYALLGKAAPPQDPRGGKRR